MNELIRKTIMRCFLKFILPLVFMALSFSSIHAVTDPLIGYVDSVPTVAEEISSVDQNGLTIRKFRYNSRDNQNLIFAILVTPQDVTGKLPAIMFYHAGGSSAQTEESAAKYFANEGFIGMAISIPSFCNNCSETIVEGNPNNRSETARLNVEGGAENSALADSMIAALEGFNFLAAHPNVDSANMGVTGTSWGGYTTTMMAGLLTNKVKAAYSIYGSGYWDRGSFWSPYLAKLSPENLETWLTYYDAGRRANTITASYYIDAPTNDTYFWPEAVQGTLDAIPSNKNHSFNPNRNHSQANSKSRYQWMVHYLKGGELPGFAKPTLVSALENDGQLDLTVDLQIPAGVSITSANVWYADPDLAVTERQWISLPTQKVDDGTYTAQLASTLVEDKVIYFMRFEDNLGNYTSTDMGYADQIIDPVRTLTVPTVENGSVKGAGIFAFGTDATLEAIPDKGYVFQEWSGVSGVAACLQSLLVAQASGVNILNAIDVVLGNEVRMSGDVNHPDGSEFLRQNDDAKTICAAVAQSSYGMVFTTVMTSDRSIEAVFTKDEADPDEDGLSNYDEIVIHATNPNQMDTDEDGFDDGEEILKGTDPNDSQAFPERKPIELRIEKLNVPSLVIFAYWTGEVGKTYRIEYAADFQNWNILDSGIKGTGLEQSRALPGPKGYVRVVEEKSN